MTLADQLQFYRQKIGLTEAENTQLLGVSLRTIWEWEKRKVTPLAITQESALQMLSWASGRVEAKAGVAGC